MRKNGQADADESCPFAEISQKPNPRDPSEVGRDQPKVAECSLLFLLCPCCHKGVFPDCFKGCGKGVYRMDGSKEQKRQILEGTRALLQAQGPPFPSYGQIAESGNLSRQLIRYYFDNPEDMMCQVCDLLAEAYRMALVKGVETLKGPKRLAFIFDFYFDLAEDIRKPRDDQAYDAAMAFAAGSDRIRTNLRGQYTLLGQVLQLEIKMLHPALSMEDCAEISYLFVCVMYGHWKLVASLGVSENHKLIARRSIDRIIQSYANNDMAKLGNVRVWDT